MKTFKLMRGNKSPGNHNQAKIPAENINSKKRNISATEVESGGKGRGGQFLPTGLLLLLLLSIYIPVYFKHIMVNDQLFNGTKLTISSLNCNSLNMSNSAKWNQTLKICGITKLKSDIIFLSDVRISNKSLVSSENDIKNNFLHNPYERYNCSFNSTKNKRGVGILTKYDLQIEIVSEKRSEDENFLLQHIRIAGIELIIGSIYGPNNLDLEFFATLEDALSNYDTENIPVILGGDFTVHTAVIRYRKI